MCGIFGVISRKGRISRSYVSEQRDLIAYRGPDDSGIWINPDGRVGMGHRRLSILDLSPSASQPMCSDDGRFCMVFNGEIYNFNELKDELEGCGYRFKGHGDSEVVLAAYRRWGSQCVEFFNGMFALGIYDSGNDNIPPSLFLARDRAGKKPLYYSLDLKGFQFASELKALSANTGFDLRALNYYLSLGYIPKELCFASGVKKLPPACWARFDLSNENLEISQYWELPKNDAQEMISGDEIADKVEELLLDAVKIRLQSDVPVGVLLSGGLDSSLVVAAASRTSQNPIDTFTIELPGSRLDESEYAKCVSSYYGTKHHVLKIRKPSMQTLMDIAPFIDEPLADSSILPSFIVSKLTREYVTVALGGDGGDELFGGYSDYPTALSDDKRIGWIPSPFFFAIGNLATMLPAGVRGRNRISSLRHGPFQQLIWGTPYFDVRLRKDLLTPEAIDLMDEPVDAPELWLRTLYDQGVDPIDRMTRVHFGSILSDDFLVKVDRSSMYNSLEMRTPFLDYRMVEFAFSKIPSHWKVEGKETRRIQKILAGRLLPPELDIHRKQGFSIPMDEWLREDRCRTVNDFLPYLPEVIKKSAVEKLIKGHLNGRANGSRLFALVMLAIAMKNNGWK
nr:asparagine synthase (glutamine-hydrolyzing) [uncultured Desulfobacter sp.]